MHSVLFCMLFCFLLHNHMFQLCIATSKFGGLNDHHFGFYHDCVDQKSEQDPKGVVSLWSICLELCVRHLKDCRSRPSLHGGTLVFLHGITFLSCQVRSYLPGFLHESPTGKLGLPAWFSGLPQQKQKQHGQVFSIPGPKVLGQNSLHIAQVKTVPSLT